MRKIVKEVEDLRRFLYRFRFKRIIHCFEFLTRKNIVFWNRNPERNILFEMIRKTFILIPWNTTWNHSPRDSILLDQVCFEVELLLKNASKNFRSKMIIINDPSSSSKLIFRETRWERRSCSFSNENFVMSAMSWYESWKKALSVSLENIPNRWFRISPSEF